MGLLFNDGAIWFTVPAFAGTLYLVLQLAMGQLGGDLDADLDATGHDTPGQEFRLLSLQSISAFAMGGGWVGLAALRLLDLGLGWSALVGVGAGVGVAWVMVWMLRSALRLQSSGNITLGDTVGERGTVYVQVPPAGQGAGRVTLAVRNRTREFNAVQRGGAFIPTHTPVRVVDIDPGANAVTVEPA